MFRWIPIALVSASLVFPVLAEAQSPTDPVVTITDADMVGNVSFTSDKTYLLSGLVFVEDGETLSIEAGTVIKALPTSADMGEDVAALIVARGGKIFADGTARNPIIFTAEADDVGDPNDILLSSPTASRGLWGGVIILGRASINTATGERQHRGYRCQYRAAGYLRRRQKPERRRRLGRVPVRIDSSRRGRHRGQQRDQRTDHGRRGPRHDHRTRGGVLQPGRRLRVVRQHGQYALPDLRVRGRRQPSITTRDSGASTSSGSRSRIRSSAIMPASTTAARIRRTDRPYARPTIMNATYIGRGAASMGGKDNNALIFRDNAGGMYYNSIFTEFQGHVLSIEDLDPTRGAQDSKARLDAGDLVVPVQHPGDLRRGGTFSVGIGRRRAHGGVACRCSRTRTGSRTRCCRASAGTGTWASIPVPAAPVPPGMRASSW